MRNEAVALLLMAGVGLGPAPTHGSCPLEGFLASNPSVIVSPSETASADTAFTPAHDPWTGFDKVQHATFSFLWVLGSQYVLVNKADWGETRALPLSTGLSASLGIAKELYDWRLSDSRYFSRRDLVANFVGIAVGILLILY